MSEILPRDVLVRAGGACFERYGVAAMRKATAGRGGEEAIETHARADTTNCATYNDRDGTVRMAAAGKLRASWDYALSRLGLLIEPSRVNLVVQPEGLTAGNGWTVGGGVTATADYADLGVVKLTRLTGANTNNVTRAVTLTGDAVKAFSETVQFDGATGTAEYGLYDTTAAAWKCRIRVTWAADGTATAAAVTGTLLAFERLQNDTLAVAGDGLAPTYRIQGQSTSCTAANNHEAMGHGAGTATSVRVGAVQIENALFPSSYIRNVASALTRAADSLTSPIGFAPQDLTVYARLPRPVWADVSGSIGDPRLLIGINSGTGYFQLFAEAAARNLIAGFNSGSTVEASAAIPAGTSIEICAQFANLTTAGKARIDVGSGFGSYSSIASAALSAWGATTLAVGFGTSANREWGGGIERLLIARGLRTLAESQAVSW